MHHSNIFRVIIGDIVLLLTLSNATAQQTLNSAYVEQRSYQLYMDKNYKELIPFINTAIKQNINYYYLRMRIGIACYETHNYIAAEKHFKEALTFNSADNVAKEYLYYCYIYTGRYDEARVFSKTFDNTLIEKTGIDKQSSLGFIQVEGGMKMSDKSEYNNNTSYSDSEHQNDEVTNTSTYKNVSYFQLGLGHYVKNRISLFHAATYFNQENLQQKNETFTNNKNGTAYFGHDTTQLKIDDKTTQLQYYLNANIPLKHNWSVSPAFHYVNKKGSSTVDSSFYHLLPYDFVNHRQPLEEKLSQNGTSKIGTNYFVGALSFQKIISHITLSVGTTFLYGSSHAESTHFALGNRPGAGGPSTITTKTSLPNETLIQNSLTVSYSVLANSNLVIGCIGYINYSSTSTALSPYIIAHPTNRISFIASYLNNTGDNVIEANGYLINNSSDRTIARWSFTAGVALGKHMDVYALYVYENKLEALQQFNYNYNGLFVGIRIKNFNKFAN